MDKETNYWKPATLTAIVLLMTSFGFNVSMMDDDQGYLPYTCQENKMLCYKLSRVNDNGIQSYCYYDRDKPRSFKKCSTGWGLLEPDNIECSNNIQVIAYTDNGKWFCDGIGATANCIKDSSIDLPIS